MPQLHIQSMLRNVNSRTSHDGGDSRDLPIKKNLDFWCEQFEEYRLERVKKSDPEIHKNTDHLSKLLNETKDEYPDWPFDENLEKKYDDVKEDNKFKRESF